MICMNYSKLELKIRINYLQLNEELIAGNANQIGPQPTRLKKAKVRTLKVYATRKSNNTLKKDL